MPTRTLPRTQGASFKRKSMKAVVLPEYQGNIIRALRSLQLEEMQLPELNSGELLVEVSAAPCNPSDLAFIQGGYNVRKQLPAIPGFEGTGTVIDAASPDLIARFRGKRVSFFSQSDRGGSWASHIPLQADDCIIIGDDIPDEQAACFAVNPFTAFAMVELAKKHRAPAIIQNAAGGQVAKFIDVLAGNEGIDVINIVRKEEHYKNLLQDGHEYVLWQQDEDFRARLSLIAGKLQASLAFDAVGGELSGHMLGAMPEGSTLCLYGALGARTLSEIPAADVIFKRKSIRGFNMNEWKAALTGTEFEVISSKLQEMFASGVLKTEIQAAFSLTDHNDALLQYIRNMSGGKILLKP